MAAGDSESIHRAARWYLAMGARAWGDCNSPPDGPGRSGKKEAGQNLCTRRGRRTLPSTCHGTAIWPAVRLGPDSAYGCRSGLSHL